MCISCFPVYLLSFVLLDYFSVIIIFSGFLQKYFTLYCKNKLCWVIKPFWMLFIRVWLWMLMENSYNWNSRFWTKPSVVSWPHKLAHPLNLAQIIISSLFICIYSINTDISSSVPLIIHIINITKHHTFISRAAAAELAIFHH